MTLLLKWIKTIEAVFPSAPAAGLARNSLGCTISELSSLYCYLRLNLSSYLFGGLFLIGTNALGLMIPWLLKLAIDSFQHRGTVGHSPSYYATLIILAAIGQGIIRIFSRTTLLNAARRIEFQIRQALYERLLSLDLPFFSRERTGDILSRFANDLTNVRMLVGFGFLSIINTVVIYAAGLALMGRISPLLTVCAAAPFPIMIFVVKRISAAMFRRSKRAQEELARLSSAVEENVSAAPVIKAYCREDAEVHSFRSITETYLASNMAMARLRGLMIPVMASTGAVGALIVLFLGGRWVIAGKMTLGDFVAFNSYLAMLVWPTIILGWILNLMQRGAASMTRLNHILATRPTITDPPLAADLPRVRGEINLVNLTFAYDSAAVVQGVTLKIGAGMKVGIVGPVGSGKSTLAKLIPRLYPVPPGMLFIDGRDINEIPLRQLRDAIGFVPQDSFLFSRTIRDNIGYGHQDADQGSIEEATRLACFASDVARFPGGYDTLVGERGVTLSGGQKQRAAIARALVKDPAILILDDPFSAVDNRTEEAILDSLTGYYGNRTVLIVSHRLSAVRGCDVIVVLERGRVVEQGSHDELMGLGGRYAATWREQQLRQEIEAF